MGFGGFLKKAWNKVDDVATQTEQGKLFGSSVYGRYASNITGATTSARLIRRARGRQQVSIDDTLSDSQSLRPTQGYSQAQAGVAGDMQAIEDRKLAVFESKRRAEDTRARLATQVRIRRAGRGGGPTTHGGTLVTGALGLPGTATPDRGTKLGL